MSEERVLLHGHHGGLLTWGRGYDERLAEIREIKPTSEIATRERLMRVLSEGELVALPAVVLRARLAYVESERAYGEAVRDSANALDTWHRRVCVADCVATSANNWNIFGGTA